MSQRNEPRLHAVPNPGSGDPPDLSGGDADGAAVREPARALRLATTVRGVLDELRGTEPTEEVRQRLATLHDRTVEQLTELITDDLCAELEAVALNDADAVTAAELRVVLAELVGWLEGLFHGLSADLVDGIDNGTQPRSGQYL